MLEHTEKVSCSENNNNNNNYYYYYYSMGIYECASLTTKEPIVKPAQKISANIQKQNKNNVAGKSNIEQ
jgi:hypothetical protein